MSNENDEIDAVKIAFDKWYNTQGWDQWDYELMQFSAEFVMEFAEHYASSRISELEAENKRLREEQRWIPVTGTLPEVLHVRIKLSDGSEINALTQNDGDFYWELLDRFIPEHTVTHFIPQPPKEQ